MFGYQNYEPPKQCYLDISRTEAPKGEIMTGAQLYMKGNRIAIKIQSAKLDQFKNVVESSRHWTDSPPNGNQEGSDFVVLRNRAKYVNIHPIIPKPIAPMRGASLFLHDDSGGYRVNVSMKTGLCDIEDVWQLYDLPTMAERFGGNSSLSAQVYSDKVYLQCSDSKYVDSHCFVGPLPSEFELVQLGSNKIGFRMQLPHANALWHIYNESKDGGMYGTYISGNPRPEWALEWVEAENGTIALKAFNGKYLGRKFLNTSDSMLVANHDRVEAAEKFRVIPKFK